MRGPLALVDVVIFAALADALHVLLVQRAEAPHAGKLALPGGFVDVERDATLEDCARRKLKEKAGVDSPYLEQLGTWGGSQRDPRGWTITTVYFALLPANAATALQAGANSAEARWVPVVGNGVGRPLAFDHAELLDAAVRRLRGKVEYTSLAAFLLPREFTLTELQRAYETVLGRELEKSSFRTRVLATDLIVGTGKTRAAANRPAKLYRLRSATKPIQFARTFEPREG